MGVRAFVAPGGRQRRLLSGTRALICLCVCLVASATLYATILSDGTGIIVPTRPSTDGNADEGQPPQAVPLAPRGAVEGSGVVDLTNPPRSAATAAVNGVILFLAGGRWDSYFHRECLPRLEKYFLACHPHQYPVRIFHELMAHAQQTTIRALIPSARAVVFEDVAHFWKSLPRGVREDTLVEWMQAGAQRKFQGRGYRIMCRFWAGLVWRLPSMHRYEYYWRLDTDSILTGPPAVDPFIVMQQRGCDYGFNRLKGENPHVAVGLWDSYQAWVRTLSLKKGAGHTPPRWFEDVQRFAVDPQTKQFWAPMYYNNFELGTMRLKRHRLYDAWFEYVDTMEPFGIFRHRWGDAPLHTLGVMTVLAAEGWSTCNFSKADVGYRHAATKPGPIFELSCDTTQPPLA